MLATSKQTKEAELKVDDPFVSKMSSRRRKMSDAESSEEEEEEILTDDENGSEVGGSLPAAEVTSGSPTEADEAVQASEDENSGVRGPEELGPEASEGGSDVPESDVEVSIRPVLCLATHWLEFTSGRLQPSSTTLEINPVVRHVHYKKPVSEKPHTVDFFLERRTGCRGQPLWLLSIYDSKSPASGKCHIQYSRSSS